MLIKYYSTQRPVGIGTYPDNSNFCEFENYGCKKYIEEIGRGAWGYILYREPLTDEEMKRYNLVEQETLDLKDRIKVDGIVYLVSTVKLMFAIDEYRYETMIFENNGRYNDLYCDRYTTKREAIDCHVEIVDQMKKGIKVWDGWNY